MTLTEYLNKITREGTYCLLPNDLVRQETHEDHSGDEFVYKGVTIVKYTSESLSEAKKEAKLVREITTRALCVKGDNASIARFYKALMVIVPKDFRNGERDESFTEWFMVFMDSIAAALATKLLTERFTPSVRALLATLQTRIDSWSKRCDISKDESSGGGVSITFSGFGGDNGDY